MLKRLIICILFFMVFSCSPEAGEKNQVKNTSDLRIITTAPSLTETVYFLGGMKNLVAVTDYCRFPEEVKSLPKIGALFNQNLEQIIALHPHMLIHLPSAEKALSGLKRFGIQLLEVKNETTEDILASIMTIGQAIHKKDKADSLVSSLKEMLKPIKKMSAKKTVIIISRRPGTLKEIYVAGPETFLSQGFFKHFHP